MASAIEDGELDRLFKAFEHQKGVVLAVSGGADSMALMVLAARWRDRGGQTPLAVATIDHGLRPQSVTECKTVMVAARALGFTARTLRWTGEKPATRIQETARHARYDLLAGWLAKLGWNAIATAHTADDQAETVLMRLMRGSGIDGLRAMEPLTERSGFFHLRPLLTLRKAHLVEILRENGVDWIEDPSNSDPQFERVRMRQLLAALDESGLVARRIETLAMRAGRAVAALESVVDAFFAMAVQDILVQNRHPCLKIDGLRFFQAPADIRLRIVARAISKLSAPGERSFLRLERVETLLGALDEAHLSGRVLRRTCAGALIALHSDGDVTVRQENRPNRRG